jgi:hypothetical protein
MEVLLDEGNYRHLRFASPEGGGYKFDLITWPNRLTFVGEVGTYVFSIFPTEDFFQVIWGTMDRGGKPNFGYWKGLLKAASEEPRQFSPEKFDEKVKAALAQAEKNWPGITDHWYERTESLIADYSTSEEHDAREAVADFIYTNSSGEDFRMRGFFDPKRFLDYDWRYLWACHALAWGVVRYDDYRAQLDAQR